MNELVLLGRQPRALELFAGAGGGVLGGMLLGWCTRCAVEIDAHCRNVLLARQRDGILPRFPIWGDVCTFRGAEWRGEIDIVAGGFPCQNISVAGDRTGIEGDQSGLWSEMARIICEVRPRFVFVENTPALTVWGLCRVLGDLASMGYNAEWGVLGADDAGLCHTRKRIWILAHAIGANVESMDLPKPLFSYPEESRRWQYTRAVDAAIPADDYARMRGDCDDVAGIMDRLKAIGNGQVPAVAANAWTILRHRITKESDEYD